MPFRTANFLASHKPSCIIRTIERRRADGPPECESEGRSQRPRQFPRRQSAPPALSRCSPSVSSTLLLWWIQTQASAAWVFFRPASVSFQKKGTQVTGGPSPLTANALFACAERRTASIIEGFSVMPAEEELRESLHTQAGRSGPKGRPTTQVMLRAGSTSLRKDHENLFRQAS